MEIETAAQRPEPRNASAPAWRRPKPSGKRLGRQPGQRPKSDRLAPKVLALVAQGRSYRLVGHEVGLSKNTVADIGNRMRASLA